MRKRLGAVTDLYLVMEHPVRFDIKLYLRSENNFKSDNLDNLKMRRDDGWIIKLFLSGKRQCPMISISNKNCSSFAICSQPGSRDEAEMFFKLMGVIKK